MAPASDHTSTQHGGPEQPETPQLDVWALIGIGTFNVVTLLIGLGVGWFVDARLGSFPVGALVGLACGIGLGLTGSWLQIRKYFTHTGSS